MTKIDRNAKRVETDKGVYDYDILVVALGFVSETFGIEGMKDYAFQIENVLTLVNYLVTLKINLLITQLLKKR